MWHNERRIHRYLAASCRRVLLACALLVALFGQANPVAAQAAAANGPEVQGRVVDASGNAVTAATVTLRGSDQVEHTVLTDASGHFTIPVSSSGRYQLRASKAGVQSAATDLPDGGSLRQDLVLTLSGGGQDGAAAAPSAVPSMDFSDKPSFTIAGVTDWTAAGGHGSDATLRASEEVTRSSLLTLSGELTRPEIGRALSTSQREQEAGLSAKLLAHPEGYTANRDLGDFYLHAGRYGQAASLLKKAAGLPQAKPEDEYDLALACHGLGDLPEARFHIARALGGEDKAEYHVLAGQLAEAAGDPVHAVQHFERAARLNQSEANYFAWGGELLAHRAIWQAVEVLRSGVKNFPDSVRLKTALGAALFAGARYEDAAQQLCAASDQDPADKESYLLIGKVLLAAPEPLSCVITRLERFLAVLPNNPSAHYFMAMLLLKQSGDAETTRVTTLLQEAVALDPKCDGAYLQLGILAFHRQRYADAVLLYRHAISANPQQAEAHFRLGAAYDRMSKPIEAQQEFRRHDELANAEAESVEQQRRHVKQFVVRLQGKPDSPTTP